jgi:hypothetical protein
MVRDLEPGMYWPHTLEEAHFEHVRALIIQTQLTGVAHMARLIPTNDAPVILPLLETVQLNLIREVPKLIFTLERWLQARADRGLFIKKLSLPFALPSGWLLGERMTLEMMHTLVSGNGGEVEAPLLFAEGSWCSSLR